VPLFFAQLDKAAADAAEFKAGYDKLQVDSCEQQAQLAKAAADTAEYKAGYDKLVVDTVEQKAQVRHGLDTACYHELCCEWSSLGHPDSVKSQAFAGTVCSSNAD